MISIRPPQLVGNRKQIVLILHLDDSIGLGGITHQLARTGIHHAHGRIAVLGEIVNKDVGNGETAGRLPFLQTVSKIPRRMNECQTNVNG